MRTSTSTSRNGSKPKPFSDLQAARWVLRVARTLQAPPADKIGRFPPEWAEGVLLAEDLGPKGIDAWLKTMASRYRDEPDRFRQLGKALDDAKASPDADEPDEPQESGPAPFTLGMLSSEEFFAETYDLEWLIRGVMVAFESMVAGGPSKALKTSILIDQFISMGTATPFLGRFPVPSPIPVGLISGESGRRVIQANAREVLAARGLTPADAHLVRWGFTLPQLTNAQHLDVVKRTIVEHELKAIGIDPLYLSLLAGSAGVDAGNMYQMGPVLNSVAEICLSEGCTPVLCHHSIKRRDNPFDPMELEDLAYAGVGQFMRQWFLISRRERFDAESGIHKLHFRYGGSAGHCGELHVDIETGKVDDNFNGRKWAVTVTTPSEGRLLVEEERKRQQEAKVLAKEQEKAEAEERTLLANVGKVVEAIRALAKRDEPATRNRIREVANLSGDKAGAALARATEQGRVETYTAQVKTGTGTRDAEAYRLVAATGRKAS